jgi:hypothetical protein
MMRPMRLILPRCWRVRKSSLVIFGGRGSRPRRAAGLDLLDTAAVPKGVTICNVFGHEPAMAEYIIMTMLVLTHRPIRGRDQVSHGLVERKPAVW